MSVFLHIGCGPIAIPGWVNVDIEAHHKPDVVLDVTKDLLNHFGPESASAIWACHTIEHYPWVDGVLSFLSDAYKVLEPNGIIRIAVPDLSIVCKAYTEGSDMTFIFGREHKGFFHYDCPAERTVYFFRAWEHTMLYDFALLSRVLREAGFSADRIKQKRFGESDIPGFHYDRFQSESLYVEARK